MHSFLLTTKKACANLKSIRYLTLCAVLVAVNILLGFFTIKVGPLLEISFTSLAAAVCGMICGPILAGIGGIAADLVKFMMQPSYFFIGFTLNEFLLGLLYGYAFYGKEITWKRVIITRLIVTVFINLTLTSLWLHIMYDSALFAAIRVWKNVLLFPIDCILLYITLQTTKRIVPALRQKSTSK